MRVLGESVRNGDIADILVCYKDLPSICKDVKILSVNSDSYSLDIFYCNKEVNVPINCVFGLYISKKCAKIKSKGSRRKVLWK